MTAPPLLAIIAGKRPRPRREQIARPRELALHMSVADLLRRFAHPDWRWSHFPAGEHRDVRTAAKLKQMGTQRGWSDFILIDPNGRFHALELKRKGGVLSDDQRNFKGWCITHNVPHSVCWSVDEATAVLNAWGALRLKIGGAP